MLAYRTVRRLLGNDNDYALVHARKLAFRYYVHAEVANWSAKKMLVRRNLCIALGWAFLLSAPAQCAEPEFIIQIRDHKFIPAELRVPVGRKVRIVLDNQQETPEEFESYSLNREKHIPPKSRVTLFIGPLDPGRYVYEGENDVGSGGSALGIIVAQ